MRTTIFAGLLLAFALGAFAQDEPTYLRMAPGAQIDIGHGFKATNIFLRGDALMKNRCNLLGEIVNTSDQYYRLAIFEITLYGENGILLDTIAVLVPRFDANSRRAFNESILVNPASVRSYRIVPTNWL